MSIRCFTSLGHHFVTLMFTTVFIGELWLILNNNCQHAPALAGPGRDGNGSRGSSRRTGKGQPQLGKGHHAPARRGPAPARAITPRPGEGHHAPARRGPAPARRGPSRPGASPGPARVITPRPGEGQRACQC